jgi:hypothetical protein
MSFPMPVIGRARARLRLLLSSESGMALPTAVFAMVASFALASVAVLSSVNVQQGANRDSRSKKAIAAADAGASVALLRLNRFQSKLTTATPCVGPAGESQVATSGWCPASPTESVGGATYSYRVSAYVSGGPISVVSVGASGGVSRRVDVSLKAKQGSHVFSAEQVIGESNIKLEGGPTLETDLGTNGNVELTSSGKAAVLCGDIRHGIGGTSPVPGCSGEVTEGSQTLPPVLPPEKLSTENSNCRLAETCLDKKKDTYQGKARTSTKPWDASHRFINVPNGASLTLGGKDYFVCGLFVDGELIMAGEAKVRIFFDKPENCPGLDSSNTQINISASATIKSTPYESSSGTFDVPGFYVMGSPTVTTTIILTGAAGGKNEVMIYAPYSNLIIGGNATWIGMFAGKTVKMNGNPKIKADSRIPLPEISFTGLLERTRYVECMEATASPPDANC